MDEVRLRTVSIVISCIGLAALITLSFFLEPPLISFADIHPGLVESKVKVEGTVQSIRVTSSVTQIKVAEDEMLIVSFKKLPEDIQRGSRVELIGKVQLYKGEMEIVVEQIRLV